MWVTEKEQMRLETSHMQAGLSEMNKAQGKLRETGRALQEVQQADWEDNFGPGYDHELEKVVATAAHVQKMKHKQREVESKLSNAADAYKLHKWEKEQQDNVSRTRQLRTVALHGEGTDKATMLRMAQLGLLAENSTKEDMNVRHKRGRRKRQKFPKSTNTRDQMSDEDDSGTSSDSEASSGESAISSISGKCRTCIKKKKGQVKSGIHDKPSACAKEALIWPQKQLKYGFTEEALSFKQLVCGG